jgi:hypothetical protein
MAWIATLAAVLAPSEQPAGSVIVTTLLAVDAAGEEHVPVKPLSVTVGVAAIPDAKAAGNVTVTVFAAAKAPVDVAVNASVHVVLAPYVSEPAEKETEVGAPRTTIAAPGFCVPVSRVVVMLHDAPA